MHELNERQKRFADYYIETGNASEAYRRAGYKSDNEKVITAGSSRLLANVNVSVYIDSHMADVDSKRIADANEVLEFLTSVMRGEATGKTLRGVGMGEQVISDIAPSIGERKDAAVQLGKRYRLWTEKLKWKALHKSLSMVLLVIRAKSAENIMKSVNAND